MTSAEQNEAIRQSMQDEKATKDELVRELEEARDEIEKLRALQKCECDPGEACRALGNAWAEVERLKLDVKAARAETSAVAKVLAGEPPYQASLAKRVEVLIRHKEMAEAENAKLCAEAKLKDGALHLAEQFITNGLELGFIRMPDPGTPDPAHDTPGIIRSALRKAGAL